MVCVGERQEAPRTGSTERHRRRLGGEGAGRAKVRDLQRRPVLRHEDVGRLQITVNLVLGVQVLHATGNLSCILAHKAGWNLCLFNNIVQRRGAVLHHDAVHGWLCTNTHKSNNVFVRERSDLLRLNQCWINVFELFNSDVLAVVPS